MINFCAFPQGRQRDGQGIQAVKLVCAKYAGRREAFQVPVSCGRDPDVHLNRPSANRRDTCSCKARKIFACMATGMSPISSRKSVPRRRPREMPPDGDL
jgi:hypothetical protein